MVNILATFSPVLPSSGFLYFYPRSMATQTPHFQNSATMRDYAYKYKGDCGSRLGRGDIKVNIK